MPNRKPQIGCRQRRARHRPHLVPLSYGATRLSPEADFPAAGPGRVRQYNFPKRALLTSDSVTSGVRLAASTRGPLANAGDREYCAPASSMRNVKDRKQGARPSLSTLPLRCRPDRRWCSSDEPLSRRLRLDDGVRRTRRCRHLRCLRHLDGVAFDALKFGDALLASGAHVGRFLPDSPVAPRLPGLFARRGCQWQPRAHAKGRVPG
jgi:hypothetical protein